MSAVVTGGRGFLAWHTACRMKAIRGTAPIMLDRHRHGHDGWDSAIAGADTILHFAGVNRADSDSAVESGNVELANTLGESILRAGRPVHLVYANSVQSRLDNPYGRGKAAAANILGSALSDVGGTMANVFLPNLFGEHGRPHYNSFVATFCDEIAHDRVPDLMDDREIPLLHVQRAAEHLIAAAESRADVELAPDGEPRLVSDVVGMLRTFDELYARGEIPKLGDAFARDLFNTYRSYLFPGRFPVSPTVHDDDRGMLFETHRSHGGTSQGFVSTTRPGQTRGDHYHLHKFERFIVVRGEAEISLRRLFHDQIVRFSVSEERPGYVDMPTMWVHNIRNVGTSDLVTVFWADQLYDPADPDQYPAMVEVPEEGAR